MERRKRTKVAIALFISGFLVLPTLIITTSLQYNTSVQRVVMPGQSAAAAFDPSDGVIYVSALYKDQVYAYNSSDLELKSTISTNGMLNFLEPSAGLLYDPYNGLLYVAGLGANTTGVSIINTSDNSLLGAIKFGYGNFPGNMVLGKSGLLYVLEGIHVTVINGTSVVGNFSTGVNYDYASFFALNSESNTSYLLYGQNGMLLSAENLMHLNGSSMTYNEKLKNSNYMHYEKNSKRLLVGTSNQLLSLNVSNAPKTSFQINLQRGSGGIKATMFSNTTGYIYISTYGSQALYVYNGTTGSYVGTMRQTDNYNTPTGILQLSGNMMAVAVGNNLILENEVPANLQPNPGALEFAIALAASVLVPASIIVYFWHRKITR